MHAAPASSWPLPPALVPTCCAASTSPCMYTSVLLAPVAAQPDATAAGCGQRRHGRVGLARRANIHRAISQHGGDLHRCRALLMWFNLCDVVMTNPLRLLNALAIRAALAVPSCEVCPGDSAVSDGRSLEGQFH